MDTFAPLHATNARRLAREDLDTVVGIDARLEGQTRRTYFERRLAAAFREPDLHIQVAVDDDDGLAGYMLGRVMEGEFGRVAPSVRLETLGARIRNWAEGDGGVWCVMLDPEGNEFCVMPPDDEVA